jgi:septum formation protein
MLVLASSSPRRRDLLARAGFFFLVDSIPVSEEQKQGEDPAQMVRRLARAKAEAVFRVRAKAEAEAGDDDEDLMVLGADTVVVCHGEVLGKPVDHADAARMLRVLSGRTHQVLTGVCLITQAGAQVEVESTSVTMARLREDDIHDYIATGEPMDKAGAYAIQGRASRWISHISGCYFNVVGLPVARVHAMIEKAEAKH